MSVNPCSVLGVAPGRGWRLGMGVEECMLEAAGGGVHVVSLRRVPRDETKLLIGGRTMG